MANPEDEAHGRLLRELRAPLNQIIGESERLEQEAQQAGQDHFVATLRKIAEAARRANEQIRRLARGLELRNQFIRTTFGRYLGDEFVAGLLEGGEGLKLDGQKRTVTVLMSDLRGFTSATEGLPPEAVVGMLNSYLAAMVDVIAKHQGTIDEFIGDAILVLFGAPVARDDDARRAVACAVEMQLAMASVNERFRREWLPEVEMGIAINTGPVVVGNIGSRKRAKYGVVGSHVNLAARIESFTVGGQILVSEHTLLAAGPAVHVGRQMDIQAKGFKEAVALYELKGIGAEYKALPAGEVLWPRRPRPRAARALHDRRGQGGGRPGPRGVPRRARRRRGRAAPGAAPAALHQPADAGSRSGRGGPP